MKISNHKYSHIKGFNELKMEQRIINSTISSRLEIINTQLGRVSENLSPLRLFHNFLERITDNSPFVEIAIKSYHLIRSFMTSRREATED